MMGFVETASIVFSCVAASHLGLVAAIEEKTGWRLSVMGCPKCLTFWSVLVLGVAGTLPCHSCRAWAESMPLVLAVSFLCAWLATWLDLAMGLIDRLYLIAYGKIYPTADTADADALDADDAVPGMR